MSKLFGGGKSSTPAPPEPAPPATMPDPEDPMAKRERRKTTTLSPSRTSSAAADRLTTVPGTIGREFSRGTLGA
ncbi:hypothetical protein ACQKP1_15880 [Allorhizobium sp. NPDC080224]|uniref:hypothetical protein n=1 Tax=Allorhizobium sp. NPDC080224 TaxID=3390547 RepID=UPI003D015DBD